MSRHPYQYGDDLIAKVTAERLLVASGLSEIDIEVLTLRLGKGMQLAEIARVIGEKYYGRTAENPLWERSIRYRLTKALDSLRKFVENSDMMSEDQEET